MVVIYWESIVLDPGTFSHTYYDSENDTQYNEFDHSWWIVPGTENDE